MSNYNIISPLAITHDERGESFLRGLGDTPVNPFLAGVEGIEKGLAFGAELSAKIQKTNRDNDPDVLAAEKLREDLANQQAQQAIRSNELSIGRSEKYGDELIEAELEYKRAQAYRQRNIGDDEDSLARLTKQSLIDKRKADIAESREKLNESKRMNSPAQYDEATGGFTIPEPASAEYDGSFPTVPLTPKKQSLEDDFDPASPEIAPVMLKKYSSKRESSKQGQLNNLVKKSTGLAVRLREDPEQPGSADVEISDELGKYTFADGDNPLDAPTALATLADLNSLHKISNSENTSQSIAGATAAVLDRVPIDKLDEYIASLPEEKREYLSKQRDTAAAIIAMNGNTQYLSQEQKAIQAAKLPFSSLIDPTGTYKEALSYITDGNTATDNIDFKNALDGNQYHAALSAASKNGTQSVSVREIKSPPAPKSDGPDIATQTAPPPTMIEFRGEDGTVIFVPTPIVDAANPDPSELTRKGQLRFAEQTAAKLNDVVSVNQKTDTHIKSAQNAVQQGGMQTDTSVGAPVVQTDPPRDKPVEHPKMPGVVLSPTRAHMQDYWTKDYKRRKGNVLVKDIDKIDKEASEFAQEQIKDYQENVLAPAKKAIDKSEDAQHGFETNNLRLESLIKEAKEKGFEDVFGPGWAETERTGISWISRLPLTPQEMKERNEYRAKFELWQSRQVRDEAHSSASTMRTNAEQRTALLSNPNLGHSFENLEFINKSQKNAIAGSKDVIKLERMVQARGYLMDSADLDAFVSEYINAKANLKQIPSVDENGNDVLIDNPNYRTPEDFLYGRDPSGQKKSEEIVPAQAPSSPSGKLPPGGGAATASTDESGGTLLHMLPFVKAVGYAVANPTETIVGTPEQRAEIAKNTAAERLQSFPPQARQEIDAYKEELNKSLDSSAAARAVMGLHMIISNIAPITQAKVGKKLEDSYDVVVNKAQSLIGYSAEEINANQRSRDVERTAEAELIEDQKLEHPWVNAAAATVAFATVAKAAGVALDGVGGAAVGLFKKAGGPTIEKATEYIGQLAKTPKAKFLRRINEAGIAQAVNSPNPESSNLEEYGIGAALGVAAEGAAAGIKGGVRATGRGIKRVTGVGQRTPAESLAHSLERADISPDVVDAANTAAADTLNPLGELSPQATKTVQGTISSPAAVGAVDARALAAKSAAEIEGAQKAAGLHENQLPDRPTVGAEYNKAVESRVAEAQPDVATMTAEQRAAFDLKNQTQDAARVQGLTSEAQTLRSQAADTAQSSEALKSGGVSRFVKDLIGAPIQRAKTALKALTEHTNISAGDELTSGTSGGSNPVQTVREGVKNLEAAQIELRNAYSPEAKPGDPSSRVSLYKVMEETYPHFDTDSAVQLGETLRAENNALAETAIHSTNRSVGGEVGPDIQPTFKFMDELHRKLSNLADTAYQSGNKVDGPTYARMRQQVADFIDNEVSALTDKKHPGLGQSEKPYTELNKKYGAVREVDRRLGFYKRILKDVKSSLAKTDQPRSYENKIFSTKNLERFEQELGPELTDQLRDHVRAIDKAHQGMSRAMRLESKAGRLEEKAAQPPKGKEFKPKIEAELAEDLKTAQKFTGSDVVVGNKLLQAENPEMIRQVKSAIGDENTSILERAMRRAIADRLESGKSLTKTHWNNIQEVLSKDEVEVIKNFQRQAENISKSKEVFSQTSSGPSSDKKFGHIPVTHYGLKHKLINMAFRIFDSPAYSGLTKKEQATLARKLSTASNAELKKMLEDASNIMRGKSDVDIAHLIQALGVGYGEGVKYADKAYNERKKRKKSKK